MSSAVQTKRRAFSRRGLSNSRKASSRVGSLWVTGRDEATLRQERVQLLPDEAVRDFVVRVVCRVLRVVHLRLDLTKLARDPQKSTEDAKLRPNSRSEPSNSGVMVSDYQDR